MVYDKIVYLHNTGGWLSKEDSEGNSEFCGAEIFIYDSNGMRSESIV